MRRMLPVLPPTFVAAVLTVTRLAGSAAEPAPKEPIAVRAGSSFIASGRVAQGFSRLHAFQRKKYGTTQSQQLRGYVERVVVRDLVLAERGKQLGMLTSARVQAQHKVVLGDALVETLRARVERENPVTDSDVKNYYSAHPELFKTPERLRIMRLLVDTEAEALALIDQAKRLPTMDDWRNLVREKSKDKATAERGGDLGFVAADGTTDVPELEVDRALFVAAQGVKDGEIVRQPIPEGKRSAVVWRRGSLAAKTMELGRENPRIRLQLLNDRVEREARDLIARLRREHLREHHPERVASREFPIDQMREASPQASSPAPSSTALEK